MEDSLLYLDCCLILEYHSGEMESFTLSFDSSNFTLSFVIPALEIPDQTINIRYI